MPTRLETASTIADITSKTIVTLGLIAGGGWALYKYVIQESPSAQLAIEQIKRICSERGSLDIKIEVASGNKTLLGTVLLKNIGTRSVDLSIPSDVKPISVAELDFSAQNELRVSKLVQVEFPFIFGGELGSWSGISVLPGRTTDLHFVAPVDRPGTYLISFLGGPRSTIPEDDVCSAKEESADWAAHTIYEIKAQSNNGPK